MCFKVGTSFLISSCLVLLIAIPSIAVSDDELHKICSNTSNQEFCLTVLENNPGTAKADLRGLVGISINLTYHYVEKTIGIIYSLYRGTPAGPLKDWYARCNLEYDLGLRSLDMAIKEWQDGVPDVDFSIQEVKSRVSLCEGLAPKPKPSTLDTYNQEILSYADLITSLTSILRAKN